MRTVALAASRALPFVLAVALGGLCRAEAIVDFDDLALAPESYWNGPDPDGTIVPGPHGDVVLGDFESRGARFVNRYDTTFGSWSGFAYSNISDTTTPGFTNQFSAITGTGRGPGADNYGVAFGYDDVEPNLFDDDPFDPADPGDLAALPTIELPEGCRIDGMSVTNTTYAALSMLNGDGFAKMFGGPTGDDPDFFRLTAYGSDASGRPLPGSAEFYLADYRFEGDALDYVVTDWEYFDLGALSGARRLHFNLSSTDVGDFGMNTPAYFAVDDIRLSVVPEPSTIALVAIGLSGAGQATRRRSGRGGVAISAAPAG